MGYSCYAPERANVATESLHADGKELDLVQNLSGAARLAPSSEFCELVFFGAQNELATCVGVRGEVAQPRPSSELGPTPAPPWPWVHDVLRWQMDGWMFSLESLLHLTLVFYMQWPFYLGFTCFDCQFHSFRLGFITNDKVHHWNNICEPNQEAERDKGNTKLSNDAWIPIQRCNLRAYDVQINQVLVLVQHKTSHIAPPRQCRYVC